MDSDVDEALAIAAHQLTKPQQKLDTQCALRIRLLDIEASSIPVSLCQLGETGVISVDHWHRDLIGDRGTMTRLTSLVREALAERRGSNPKVEQISVAVDDRADL